MMGFGQYVTSLYMASSFISPCLVCDFCSSDLEFASDFLQILSHGGHPCLWLTVPTAKLVADLYSRVIVHIRNTAKNCRRGVHKLQILRSGSFHAKYYDFQYLCFDIILFSISIKCALFSSFHISIRPMPKPPRLRQERLPAPSRLLAMHRQPKNSLRR